MAARASLRVVDDGNDAFELARRRWETVSAERRRLQEQLTGARYALGLVENPPGVGDMRSPRVEQLAAAFLNGRKPNADIIRRQIIELEDRLAQQATQHSIEAAAWRVAVEDEARHRAERLRPRHREAVRLMAAAVEALSAAAEAERAARAELAEVGGIGALPDASREFGTLHEYNSVLSSWNRRVLAEALLD